jgi:hypothetical protein
MTRKWLCQRLLSNPQHSRMGTAHPGIRGHHLLWRNRGSPKSTRNFHRPRIQAHRTSGCRRTDSSARTTRDWHLGPCSRSSFLRAKYTKRVWHFHISCASRTVKCPLLTSAKLESIKASSKDAVTNDTYESMAKSRYASAVGISVGLDEIRDTVLDEAMRSETCWSSKASCSSGAELEDCHILIIASDPSSGNLRAASTYMEDAIDARAVMQVLKQIEGDRGHVLQVFAKAEADPRGNIRGKRHTMNTDSDIHSTRHARTAVGGFIAGLVGDTQVSFPHLFVKNW